MERQSKCWESLTEVPGQQGIACSACYASRWTLGATSQGQKALLVHALHAGASRTYKDLVTMQACKLALCHSSQPFVLRARHPRHLPRRSRSALNNTQILSSIARCAAILWSCRDATAVRC